MFPDTKRICFAKTETPIRYPDFLEIQLKSFEEFFQLGTSPEDRKREGLFKVFGENFPITDTRNNFVLEFLDYYIDPPRYAIEECLERGLTYSVPLKAKLKLYCTDPEHEDFDTVVQDVYLGTIPYMLLTAPRELLFLSCTVHQVFSLVRAYMLMVLSFTLHVLSHSRVRGLSLLQTLTM